MRATATRLLTASIGAAVATVVAPGLAGGATITVGVTNDEINADADCSLREAIQSANTNASNTTGCTDGDPGPTVDTIALTPSTQYGRSIPPDGTPDDNQDGDLDVFANTGGPVAIEGGSIDGNTLATIASDGQDRVLDQAPSGTLTLAGVRVTDGFLDDPIASGAGVRSSGTLIVVDSVIADNHTDQADGGGVWSGATLTLEDAIVTENTAGGTGGGIRHGGGSLTIEGSTIAGNDAGTDPAAVAERGGGVYSTANEITITDSTFDQNGVGGLNAAGGGLSMRISSTGTKTITGSRFTANDSEQAGGGIDADFNSDTASFTVADSLIEANDAGPGPDPTAFGGGIKLDQADLTLVRSVIRGNDATEQSAGGGGLSISDDGSAMIDDSVIADNHAISTSSSASGGGIRTDSGLVLRRTTIASNSVDGTSGNDLGAGLYAGPTGAHVNAYNLTVHGNLALDAGSTGGGIHVQNASSFVNLASSTVASNFAGGPGDALSESTAGPLITARNSIIEGPITDQVCDGTIDSPGYNVAEGTSCGLAGTGDEQDAELTPAPLADNGGLVVGPPGDTEVIQTRAVPPGSTAINHVPPADGLNPGCTGQTIAQLATDARGFPRPTGAGCEAGAYELTKCFGTVVGDGAIVGTEGDDVVTGTDAADLIFSLAGNDAAKGKGGADRICTSGGKDELKGGDGPDKLNGGKGKDGCSGGAGTDKAKACESKSGIP